MEQQLSGKDIELLRRSKRPVTAVAGPYGHPWHPALVVVPIGAWIASLIFDIGSHIVDDPEFLTRGSRWLIAIGVIGGLVAAIFGFLDFRAIPAGTPAKRTALTHLTINLIVTIAYLINFLIRGDQNNTAPVGWGVLVLSAISLAALSVSGYLGGKLAYRYGIRVADEATQIEGFHTMRSPRP
jgi:uncharacterized membrane protein